MFCDFMLLSKPLLQHAPSLLGAVAIYATNRARGKARPWNAGLTECTGGLREADLKPLAEELFAFIRRLEQSQLRTLFIKYDGPSYLRAAAALARPPVHCGL
jgi:hypothetical protein